jgi:hypothetical protein
MKGSPEQEHQRAADPVQDRDDAGQGQPVLDNLGNMNIGVLRSGPRALLNSWISHLVLDGVGSHGAMQNLRILKHFGAAHHQPPRQAVHIAQLSSLK